MDVINNIQKYADIDYYEKNLLKQNDKLTADVAIDATTITVEDAQSFPKKNGYIRIDDEIIFYATRTNTEFRDCSRGVSGNTSLGDLYEASKFESTEAGTHSSGAVVHNVSNLFLYALVKNFEAQYLGSFPEKYLKGEIDKEPLSRTSKSSIRQRELIVLSSLSSTRLLHRMSTTNLKYTNQKILHTSLLTQTGSMSMHLSALLYLEIQKR